MASAATAGIIIIGDEILSGQFADENAAFLIGELRTLGVSLKRIVVIPDEPQEIASTVRDLSGRLDLVFTSGGVGPTHDDVTIAAIASAFDSVVIEHPDLLSMLQNHLGPNLEPPHRRLAEVPDGSEMVYGAGANSPVVKFRNIYILPGVPGLFRKKFHSIAERFRCTPFTTGRLYSTADEAALAPTLSAAVAAHPEVAFGSYPRFEETDFQVMITVKSKDPAAAQRAFDDLRDRLGEHLWRAEEPA